MKLLLTSAGVKNDSIHNALLELLGKPIAECNALCIPTASYAHPMSGAAGAWRFISGQSNLPMTALGWKSLGVLELTALPSISKDLWVPLVEQTDVLLVGGGDASFLNYWIQQSGLAEILPSLHKTVWVGLSAGSMVLTPRIGEEFIIWTAPDGDKTLGLVDFSIFPHLTRDQDAENTLENAALWAAKLGVPGYAIDNDTAIKVVDGAVEIISEGEWHLFTP